MIDGIVVVVCSWEDGMEAEAENVWNQVHLFNEMDSAKGKEGCGLDEMMAHRFLEKIKETLTVRSMREKLRFVVCNTSPHRVQT